jgi:anti-sigma factor RsiW
MECPDYRTRLHDYFHGSLAPDERAEVDGHAAACGPCGDLMRVARELSCKDFVSFLNQYIDGELLPERRAVFERHLAICPDCTAYLDSYKKTMSLSVQVLREGAFVQPAIPDELLKAILESRQAG